MLLTVRVNNGLYMSAEWILCVRQTQYAADLSFCYVFNASFLAKTQEI